MSKVCMVTGKKAVVGNNVSHSNNRTKRRFKINIQKKRFYVPSQERYVTLKVSTQGIKIIAKKGIEAVLKEMAARGVTV